MVKSAYIHIPFCKNICSYCDFCKFYYKKEWINSYLDSLETEIKKDYKGEELNTLYIGGGTPSSLSLDELKRLFEITKMFKLNNEYEFTIEFNVEDIDEEKLLLCKNSKVNRISIGVESFNKINLEFLERRQGDYESKIKLAKKYFDNINIDLIYALPNESKEVLINDLDKILELDIPHISCYSLILEEHTKLFIRKIVPIDEEIDYEMYKIINDKLIEYNHYEISNYSKEGYESKHNLNYWYNNEYYGFGCGASSYIGNSRRNNSRSINKYLNKIYRYEEEYIDIDKKISYELILGFRKTKGINIEEFRKEYNRDIKDLYNVRELVDDKKLIIENGYIFVNSKYLYIENEILVNFL